jgi:hypothetical protein
MTDPTPETDPGTLTYRTEVVKTNGGYWKLTVERYTGTYWKEIYTHHMSFFKFNATYRANKFIREYNKKLNNPSSGYKFYDANGKRVRRWET